MAEEQLKRDALEYHEFPTPGKMTAKGANRTDIPVSLLPLRCR